jgi:hypothetical protein
MLKTIEELLFIGIQVEDGGDWKKNKEQVQDEQS